MHARPSSEGDMLGPYDIKEEDKKFFFPADREIRDHFSPLRPFLSFSSIISDFSEETPKENRLHAILEGEQRERLLGLSFPSYSSSSSCVLRKKSCAAKAE